MGSVTSDPGTARPLGPGRPRVVIAEDSVLLLAGLTKLLDSAGFVVAATAGDASGLLAAVEREQPDVVIADVRMPPSHTDEGIRAALVIRSQWPDIAILVLSQYVEERYAADLLSANTRGVGYLLKDRVADVAEFLDALRRVAAGGTALDPEVVAQLLVRRGGDPLGNLTQRKRRRTGHDGGGPLQRGDRHGPGDHRQRGQQAHQFDLRQAGPVPRRHRPPAGTRGPALPRRWPGWPRHLSGVDPERQTRMRGQ